MGLSNVAMRPTKAADNPNPVFQRKALVRQPLSFRSQLILVAGDKLFHLPLGMLVFFFF